MDKDLERDIRRVAQAERLADEEKMGTRNLAGIIEVNEDLEDKADLITKLQRKLRNWKVFTILGFIALLIVITYTVYVTVILPRIRTAAPSVPIETVDDSTEVIEDTEQDVPVDQVVADASLYFMLDVPQISLDDLNSTSIQQIAKDDENLAYCSYDGTTYIYVNQEGYEAGFYAIEIGEEPELAPDDTIYMWTDLDELISGTSRSYTSSQSAISVPDYSSLNSSDTKDRDINFGIIGYTDDSMKVFYSNLTSSASTGVNADNIANIINPLSFEVVVYDDVDVDTIESDIKSVLSSEDYSFTSGLFNSDTETAAKAVGVEIADAISNRTDKFKITCTSALYGDVDYEIYNYYDSVTTEDGQITCTVDDTVEVPAKVLTLNITDYEILYDDLACAYNYGWYEKAE
jgi:hypothetical protein